MTEKKSEVTPSHCSLADIQPGGEGGLPNETNGDARRLA